MQTHLYRIVQESVYNALKHAEATEVLVQVNFNSNLSLTIEDNGKGFDPQATHKGVGLKNILSRTESLRGEWNTESSTKGTTHSFQFTNQIQDL
jgi:signal transduction histidine kinase